MMSWLLILLPLAGVACVVLSPGRMARAISLVTSLAVFGVSVAAAIEFWAVEGGSSSMAAIFEWLPAWGIEIEVGADSVSMVLVLLTTLLMPLAIVATLLTVRWLKRIDGARFYVIIYGLMVLLGAKLLWDGIAG